MPETLHSGKGIVEFGNDLFFSFLNENFQYNCDYFNDTDDSGVAQQKKIALDAGKRHLCETDQLLNIGCGWGELAYVAGTV